MMTGMEEAGTTADPPSEYDRFEELAKRLVGVPKKELDEARKRDELAKGQCVT